MARSAATVAVFGLCAGAWACGGEEPERSSEPTMEDVRTQAREAADTAGDYLAARRDAFVEEAESRLDGLERDLRKLRRQAGDDASRTIGEAERRLQRAREKLEEAREAGGEGLERFRGEMEQALAELERAYEAAAQALRG